jgi:hypothetical protein
MKEGRNYDKTVRTVFHRARAPELSLVMPECNPIGEPDERMGVGFHNVSHSSDALGHCVTFRGYGDVVKGPRISVSGRRGGRKMQLIEPDERQAFVATLQRKGLAEGEFELLETETTDPMGDENVGLQGYVTVTRLSTQIASEYPSDSKLVGYSNSDRISKLASSISRD